MHQIFHILIIKTKILLLLSCCCYHHISIHILQTLAHNYYIVGATLNNKHLVTTLIVPSHTALAAGMGQSTLYSHAYIHTYSCI